MTKDRRELTIFGTLFALGTALHAYEFLLGELRDTWFFFWSMLPYVVCVVLTVLSRTAVLTIAATAVVLLLDTLTHYEVFVNPRGSTAALALLWTPLWNTIIFVPGVMVITRLIVRKRGISNLHAL